METCPYEEENDVFIDLDDENEDSVIQSLIDIVQSSMQNGFSKT